MGNLHATNNDLLNQSLPYQIRFDCDNEFLQFQESSTSSQESVKTKSWDPYFFLRDLHYEFLQAHLIKPYTKIVSSAWGSWGEIGLEKCDVHSDIFKYWQYLIKTTKQFNITEQGINLSASFEEEINSPFDKLDQDALNDERILKIIDSFNGLKNLPYRERLIRRLTFLLEIEMEEDPENWKFYPESLSSFLHFIRLHQNLKYPDVCLTPDGFIQVQWREASNRNLVLEFLLDHSIHFVLFKQKGDQAELFYGVAGPESVWEEIKIHGADKWCIS